MATGAHRHPADTLRGGPGSGNVFLFGAIHGLTHRRLEPRYEGIVARAGVAHLTHTPLKDLSMGQAQRLALSLFAETTERFLIFDEVLGNVGRGFTRTADACFRAVAQSFEDDPQLRPARAR